VFDTVLVFTRRELILNWHGAIDHAQAEVGGASATRGKIEVDGADAPIGFISDRVLNQKIVPFTRHRHVGVAIEPELAGPAGRARRQSRNHGPLRRLRFLSAKAAAHTAHTAGDERIRQAENTSDDVLHFARMLGGRIDQDRTILARHGKRNLAFQIKVFLATDMEHSSTAQRRLRERLGDVTVYKGVVRKHALACGFALFDGNVRLLRIDLDPTTKCRSQRGIARRRNDREHRLAVELDAGLR
jgi:hypothetical protein